MQAERVARRVLIVLGLAVVLFLFQEQLDISPALIAMGAAVVALLSAVVDNVPITIAVIPVVAGLEAAGVKIEPLWWALALGAGLGGNATVIGATANIVVVSVSERSGNPIRSSEWLRYGIPMMLVTCTAASILYVLFYPLLS